MARSKPTNDLETPVDSLPSHADNRRYGAFTIPEMLAVIAIIVIVISLLLPSLDQGRGAARKAVCASNLHQIHVAYRSWRANNATTGIRDTLRAQSWPGALRPFIGKLGEIYKCPEGFHDTATGIGQDIVPYVDITFAHRPAVTVACELGPLTKILAGSYGSDYFKMGIEYGVGVIDYNDAELIFEKINGQFQVTVYSLGPGPNRPSGNHELTVYAPDGSLLGDFPSGSMPGAVMQYDVTGGFAISYGMNNLAHQFEPGEGANILMVEYSKIVADVVGVNRRDIWEDQMQPRHARKMNVMFLDGSVALKAPEEIDPTVTKLHDELWEPENP